MSREGGGDDLNSHVIFTADDDATYYVAAGSTDMTDGACTLTVEEVI